MTSTHVVHIRDLELKAGVVIQGRYELTGHLGEGGFAQVFGAYDRNIERPVAIKFLNIHASQTNPAAVDNILKRFKREATLAAKIQHPNVVNVFDFGTVGDDNTVPFIVMEMLEGHDLDEEIFILGKPISPAEGLPLFIDCLEALGEAHDVGIVHKDLKPSNLFLSESRTGRRSLRIVDFGIAHIKDAAEGRLTATGDILGTPQYLPPEYIESQIVTPAYDVYQMAIILVEMLTARPVINESHPLRCIQMHATGELPIYRPLLESPLGEVLGCALDPDHTQRYKNATAFAKALADIDPASLPVAGPDDDRASLAEIVGTRNSAMRVGNMKTGNIRPDTGPVPASSPAPPQEAMDQPGYQQPTGSVLPRERTSTAGTLTDVVSQNKGMAAAFIALALVVLAMAGVAAFLFLDEGGSVAETDAVAAAEAPAEEAAATDDAPGDDGPAEATALAAAAAEEAQGEAADDAAAAAEEAAEPAAGADEKAAAAPSPKTIEVQVSAEPSDAKVYDGETFLGQAPVTVAFTEGDDATRKLTLKRSGYDDETIEVNAANAPALLVELDRKRRTPTRRKVRKTESRPAPKPVAEKPKPMLPPEPEPAQKPEDTAPKDKKPERRMLLAP